MRALVLILLSSWLMACSIFNAENKLALRDLQLEVEPLWAVQTGEVPEYSHAQLPPFVMDDRVYVANVREGVAAVSDTNVSLAWVTRMDEWLTGGPAVGSGLVVVGTLKAELIALNAEDGEILWRSKICSEMLSTPVITAEKIFLQCIDGYVMALSVKDGHRIWSYRRPPPTLTLRGTSSPLVVEDRVIAGFADGTLVSLNLETGKLEWESTIAVPRGRNDLERIVDIDGLLQADDGVIYAVSYQGRVAAVSTENGRFLWTREMSSYSGVALGENQIFISDADARVWALDRRTGATLWRQDQFTGHVISAPAVMGPVISVADELGDIHWLDARDGQIIAEQNITETWAYFHYQWEDEEGDQPKPDHAITTHPVVTDKRLFVRDNTGALVAYEIHATTNDKP